MMRQLSDGVVPTRLSRRATPYGHSPTASSFAAAGQHQQHPRSRRMSNVSQRHSPVNLQFAPASHLSGTALTASGPYDYSSPTVPNFPNSDPNQYSSPAHGQYYDTPSSAGYTQGFRNVGLDDLSLNISSPATSPLGAVFPHSPLDPVGNVYSGWPTQPVEAPPRPATSNAETGQPISIAMTGRTRSYSGHPAGPSSLPSNTEMPRRDLAVEFGGAGGGGAMAHSHSQPGPMGNYVSQYNYLEGNAHAQTLQQYDYIVKTEEPSLDINQHAVYGNVPNYVGIVEQEMGRA